MRLKDVRKARKLTQQQVADLLGLPIRTYQNYEREVNDPDTDIICKLADYYGVTTDYLIGYSEIAVAGDLGSDLSDEEMKLVGAYRRLPNVLKASVLTIVKELARAYGGT